MAAADKPVLKRSANESELDVGDILSKRFGGVSIYVAIMLLLAIAIVWTGVQAAEQVQQYHQDYKVLQDMRKQHRKLQVEHQRLLIEQQTFSATPQIASRAVAELGMYSPSLNDKLILQPSASAPVKTSTSAQTSVVDSNQATGSEDSTASASTEVTP